MYQPDAPSMPGGVVDDGEILFSLALFGLLTLHLGMEIMRFEGHEVI
jgi:hypothetical protein